MMSATQQLPRWLSLQAHPQDNVAIVVNDGGAPPGATFQDGMTAIEHIPQGHKIALPVSYTHLTLPTICSV